ncbi:MAG: hypothetical protein KAW66_01640 [Candidatus Lokiarchaeota archaeon]|nr:hypothetical protein [Candidatus Lokiarchaeota archaeon]
MKLNIDISRQGNFIFAVLMIHFVFFGFICNVYEYNIGLSILYLNQVLFHPIFPLNSLSLSFLSSIILFLIIFFMAYREPFYEYAIRNSIWMTLLIIIQSWIWYWFINGFDFVQIGIFFISLEGYLSILIILGINVVSAFTASYLRTKMKQSLTKHKEIIL